jgi:hypothetical protein
LGINYLSGDGAPQIRILHILPIHVSFLCRNAERKNQQRKKKSVDKKFHNTPKFLN